MSRPLQVYLEDRDYERLERWARERGWTKSQAVRVALRAATHRSSGDALLDAAGMVDGLPADVSENVDHYLAETYVAEPASKYRSAQGGTRSRVRR